MLTQNAVASTDNNQIDLWGDVSLGISSLMSFLNRFDHLINCLLILVN